jgi:hypothetical protein
MVAVDDERLAEVERVLARYLVEVVEEYELCPWARAARLGGELLIDVVWSEPTDDMWVAAAERAMAALRGSVASSAGEAGERGLAAPNARVVMIVAPETAASPRELRAIRDRVAARVPSAGVADFHPLAALDVTTPARLVPFLRRSPDPLLQLVPLAILDAARARGALEHADRAAQVAALGGIAAAPALPIAERIAAANHARALHDGAAIAARLDDIAADRARAYARVGIAISTCR